MTDSLVEVTHDGAVSVLTMQHRPYNLIGSRFAGAILEALDEARKKGSRAVVIRSALRHFSAGAELEMLDEMIRTAGEQPLSLDTVSFLRALETFPIPIVASVHGVCVGGGLELALACDYIVAADSAKIGAVEVTLGIHPLMGAIQRLVQRVGAMRAKEMTMLGRRYDAATLERWGVINLVVPAEHLDSTTLSIAEELASGPTLAHSATKRLVQITVNDGVDAADVMMASVQECLWTSNDVRTGLESYRKNGPGLANFKGC